MDVYSELIKAQAENLAIDPAGTIKGRMYHKSATEPLKVCDGANVHKVITDLNIQTELSSKISVTLPSAFYSTILSSSAKIDDGFAATKYALGFNTFAYDTGAVINTQNIIYIDPLDFPAVNGATTKLRIRAQLYTNDVAPTGNFTFGLYPVTRPATSGGSSVMAFDIGTLIVGSNGATFTAPVADLLGSAVSADFDVPVAGHYVLGVVTTSSIAINAMVHAHAQLQVRNN
jgi:hypothetical protein